MKQQTINLKYSLARARALSHYLEKNGKTIEGELSSHIDDLYDALVPEEVREFVASQNPEETKEEAPDNVQKTEKTSRQNARRKHSQAETECESQTESGPILSM